MDDFDDDPIADLLSDSNDSFFEDPKLLAKKPTPKKETKSIDELFGFGTDSSNKQQPKEKTVEKNFEWLGLNEDKEVPVPQVPKSSETASKQESKMNFDDPSNMLGLSASKQAKKSAILSDILGETKKEDKNLSNFDDIFKSGAFKKKETTVSFAAKDDKSSFDDLLQKKSKETEIKPITPILGRERRGGRRNSSNLLDPLGIFGTQTNVDPPTDTIKPKPIEKKTIEPIIAQKPEPKTTPSSDLPNWLGGEATETKTKPEPVPITKPEVSQVVQNSPNLPIQPQMPNTALESLLTQQKINSSHLELQNASLALQQQESQLMVAVQLKKYEESMAEMQKKQQEMLLKQDVQFNTLLERQFAKQNIMENNMRLQQERINNHIQLLMAQPTTGARVEIGDSDFKKEYIKNAFEENRQFYDDIINGLKSKHKEEIFLLEESYRKQLTFLENSLASTETRLKTEIDSINKHYQSKLQDLEQEKEQIITKFETKIQKIHEQQNSELETIKENYKTTIAEVRNEYRTMLDDLSENKLKQDEILTQTKQMTYKVDENLEILNLNTKSITEIHTKISKDHSVLLNVKAESLNAKEIEIKMMRNNLEEQRLATDNERAQLLALIKSLETRLVEQTQNARDERWSFQQAAASLAAKSLALDREQEYVRKNLEREREQIMQLKESLLAENEDLILKLNEEKLAIVSEKSRLEVTSKLHQNFDINKGKAEIEAAIKIAREATELTDREREKLCKQQCDIEYLKRTLTDRESKLFSKEQELNDRFNMAEQKYKEGERALLEARITEQKYTERLQEIQKQISSLSAREKKLSEEKIAMSKERISLHSQMKHNKRCGLCEAGRNFKNIKQDYNEHQFPWGPETEILKLKHDMLEQENEVSKESSVIENNTES